MLVLDEADKLLSQDFKGMLDKVGHITIFMGVTPVCFFLFFLLSDFGAKSGLIMVLKS